MRKQSRNRTLKGLAQRTLPVYKACHVVWIGIPIALTTFVNNPLRDFRLAVRLLLRTPATAVAIILALALGIGANTSCFISVNAIVLHPLAYPDLGTLMTVWETLPKQRAERDAVAPANLRDWSQARSFSALAAYQRQDVNLTGGGEPERVSAAFVSPDFFRVLAMAPEAGRTFLPEEAESGHAGVAVLSHGFWERRFAGARDAVGRAVALDGRAYTIVGIMPPDFDFPLANEVWAPLALTAAEQDDRAAHTLLVLGRLRSGVTVNQARAELAVISQRLAEQHPETNEGRAALVTPILELTNEGTNRFVTVLMVTAGFVLLLACANVANLQLARVIARQKEIAVRTALGASRLRIARQLLVESALTALLGGGLGLVLASWNLSLGRSAIPDAAYRWVAGLKSQDIDGEVVLFTLAASILTGVLCILPSLWHILRRRAVVDVNDALKEGTRAASAGPGRSRLRISLGVAEVALALLLLIGAGVMVQTFQRLLTVSPGFDTKNLLTMETSLPTAKYATGVQIRGFDDRLIQGLETIHGVRSAAIYSEAGGADGVFVEGRAEPRPGEPTPAIHAVSPRYFETLRLPILHGRGISTEDGPDSPGVVVISEVIAKQYWPDSEPLGRHIRLHKAAGPWLTIVGVSRDTKNWFSSLPEPAAYVSAAQEPLPGMEVYMRTDRDPMELAGAAREQLRRVDSSQAAFNVESQEQRITEQTGGIRASARTMTMYAVIALLLALTGIYAVISYSVAQRTHEIGVRVALGADQGDILRMTLGQGVRMAGVGLAIGLPAAILLTHAMSSVLYNVLVLDPIWFAVLTALLASSAALASYIPARRAARVDPVTALRNE